MSRSLPRAFSPVLSACLTVVLALVLALPLPASSASAADPSTPSVVLEPGWLTVDPATGRARLVAGVPAEAAEDDAIERVYTGRFRHEGIAPATGLRIVIEIPRGLHYVAGSATGPRAQISVSADGGRSFAPPGELMVTVDPAAGDDPATAAGDDPATAIAPRKAQPGDYTHIRWDLPGEFAAGTAGLVAFRARPATAAASAAATEIAP